MLLGCFEGWIVELVIGQALWSLCHAQAWAVMTEVMGRGTDGDFGGQGGVRGDDKGSV